MQNTAEESMVASFKYSRNVSGQYKYRRSRNGIGKIVPGFGKHRFLEGTDSYIARY